VASVKEPAGLERQHAHVGGVYVTLVRSNAGRASCTKQHALLDRRRHHVKMAVNLLQECCSSMLIAD
jgi:hypothetical protein